MALKIDVSMEKAAPGELQIVDLQAALVDSINDMAERARLKVVEAMPAYLDKPTPFTLRGIGVRKAKPGAQRPEVEVDVLPQQARYLQYQILGGVRVAGDYATTRLGPIVPGPDAPRNAYGTLPRGYIKRMLTQPDVRWVHLQRGKPPALIRHRKGRKVEILALIIEAAHYKPRFPFYDLVDEALGGPGAENLVARRLDALSG